ncbi:unnamed protein product [Mytilus coruscus]|uniref:Uncharacterized protein n=1 Tax=Mytilus coruscus TaxID=42192 RepID=A0A6J8BQP9_MYTCO|nr:unnamed protein product [Mytilus coruscus]
MADYDELKQRYTVICGFSEIGTCTSRFRAISRSEPNSFRKKTNHTTNSSTKDMQQWSHKQPSNTLSVSSNNLMNNAIKTNLNQIRSFAFASDSRLDDSLSFTGRKVIGSSVSINSTSSQTRYISKESCSDWFQSTSSNGYYIVPILGAHGVGKKTLKKCFMNSDCMSAMTLSVGDSKEKILTTVVNNGESNIDFIDFSVCEVHNDDLQADAYVVVFSVHNRESFTKAEELLYQLRNDIDSDRPIILVANKIDLVRKRHVKYKEALKLAKEFRCKYVETSAVLNYKIDDLLVGLLFQIKLKLNLELAETAVKSSQDNHLIKYLSFKGLKRLLNKILRRKSKLLSPCENLFHLCCE